MSSTKQIGVSIPILCRKMTIIILLEYPSCYHPREVLWFSCSNIGKGTLLSILLFSPYFITSLELGFHLHYENHMPFCSLVVFIFHFSVLGHSCTIWSVIYKANR